MQANFKKTHWQRCSRILNLVNKVLPTLDYSIFAIDYDLHYNRHQLQNTTNHVSKYTSCIHHHQFGPSSHAKRLLMPLQALTSWQSWYRWITMSRRPKLQIQCKQQKHPKQDQVEVETRPLHSTAAELRHLCPALGCSHALQWPGPSWSLLLSANIKTLQSHVTSPAPLTPLNTLATAKGQKSLNLSESLL